jgi:hypothetical protein
MFACKESCSLASRNLLPRSVLVKKKVFRHSNTIKVVRVITDTYNQPNKNPQEIEAMINDGSVDILLSFSEACREKFEQSLQICSVRSLGEWAHRNSPVVNATSFNRYKQSPERTNQRPMIKIRGGRVQLRIDMNHFEVIIRRKVVFLVIAGLRERKDVESINYARVKRRVLESTKH